MVADCTLKPNMKFYINLTILFFVNIVFCHSQILINEIYVMPDGARTNQEYFIEFYNPTRKLLDLKGYKLELYDINNQLINSEVLYSKLPRGTYISPFKYNYTKINRNGSNPNFVSVQFDLNNAHLFKLINPAGEVSDFVKIMWIQNGKSFGRYPDGGENWGMSITTKNKKNSSHRSGSVKMSYDEDKNTSDGVPLDSNQVVKVKNDGLVGKIKINEVFYLISNDILKRDLWIEIINVSNSDIKLDGLMFSTDTLYGKQSFFHSDADFIKPNEVILIYLTNNFQGANSKYNLSLVKKTNVIKLFKGGVLLDSVQVPILDRDESYARIPDGSGEFLNVKYETPGQKNDQLMPGVYTKPAFVFLHCVGASLSKYTIDDNRFDSRSRFGSNMGFSFQHKIGYFDFRHSLMYKRQGFRLSYDSTLYTSTGRLEIITKGYQRMEYFGYSGEIGVPINKKIDLYYGIDFDIRLNNVSEIITSYRSILNSGEVVAETEEITNDYAIKLDNIDLNLSIALEYKFSKYAYLNVSLRRDFGGLNINNIINTDASTQLVNNQVRGQWIKTNVLQVKLVVPFYSSEKLVPKSYVMKVN
jgi:hypothetical protein